MALSTVGYTASGAGTAAANGNYVPVVGAYATYNGATQYTNGTAFLALGTGANTWNVFPFANAVGAPAYVGGGTSTTFPLSGWGVGGSTAPPPTFADMSGGCGGATVVRRPPIFF